MPLLALLLAATAPPLPAQLNDPKTTEGWIWQQVQAGKIADLNARCETPPLDIHKREDAGWQAPCRRVDPDLLRALLTQPDLADHTPHGVRIRGARIDGDLDLHDAHVRAAEVWLDGSWIAGDANVSGAQLDGALTFDGTLIDGQLNGARAVVAGNLRMSKAVFGGPVLLRDAHVDGQMSMTGASIADKQTFDADRLHVGAGGLFLDEVKFGGPVVLSDAHVDGQMVTEGASVADKQTFNAELLHVGAGLSMRNTKFGGPVDLRAAHVDSQMAMEGASVADKQTFDAEALRVGAGGLFLSEVKFGGPVDLSDAHVDGQMGTVGASIADKQPFLAERLHVSSFLARLATFGGAIDFAGLIVDGELDLRGSNVRQLYLGGAVVTDLLLGGAELTLHWNACDGPAPCLNLRNARVGNLQDDEHAWPDRITLEGFTYTHLGGLGGEQRQDMRNRPIRWWRKWLNRDPVYSAQPYAQLASVFAAGGNRDGAADIRFFGRDRERSELLRGCTWLQKLGLAEKPDDNRPCRWGAGLSLSLLQAFVGYGIGNYAFRAVLWALALALVGTVILWFAPGVRGVRPSPSATSRGPRQKSLVWCIGASLHQVLPLISINPEFNDFFNDPKRERLYPWQHVAFGVLALCGWVLAGFVAAAFSGLIQS
jgi:hypothetical protein